MFQFFLYFGSTRFSLIPIRGLRSFSLFRCIYLLLFLILLGILLFFVYHLQHYFAYQRFIKEHPLSTVPFWKDNRTKISNRLKPIRTINDVHLSNASIAIGACCRNVRGHLLGFRRNLATITALFGQYRIYLYESDSRDKTLEYLKEWQQNDAEHVRVYSAGNQRSQFSSRTARLAICRNSVIQQAYEELKSFDYYLMIDVDVGSHSSFNISNFLTNFIYPSSSWIAMTASQQGAYYDIWALRTNPTLTYDCWMIFGQLNNIFIDSSYLLKRLVGVHTEEIPRDFPPIEVQSAFGGAALFNGKYLNRQCLYHGTTKDHWGIERELCEHVPFHLCLQEYFKERKFYINPQFRIY